MTLGMHQPILGGSEYHIEFDGPKQQEKITIFLPPVGYTIDRIPDIETGFPSYQLIKCEILGETLPIEKQKWIKPQLPSEWNKFRDEEKRQSRHGTEFIHPEAEKFRAQEWTRRLNGCWQAIGNRNGKPTEYVYIPPSAYLYFSWWNPDFGHPAFRLIYLKTFYALQWAEDHPKVNGIVLSTYRRHGKTAIAGCWTVDMPSRIQFGYAGMQGQAGKKALEFFDIHLMQPFRRLEEVDFFQPKYDMAASLKSQLLFTDPPPRSNKKIAKNKALNLDLDKRKPLGGRVSCANSSETSLDGRKMHRIWLDEPGKWEKVDVLKTVLKYVPCTVDDLRRKIGLIFVPSTVEEMGKGGQEFVDLFEKSVPSMMTKNKSGKTSTSLVSVFIPAYEGVVFDEYGRSIINNPDPKTICLDEAGRQIVEGAKSFLTNELESKETEEDQIEEMRKYPWTWFQAKMTSMMRCQFNAQKITQRLQQLQALPKMPFIRGNFEWSNETDGDVYFERDETSGRFQVAWLPDFEGANVEGNTKLINNVTFEWGEDFHGNRIKLWKPLNDRFFACGADPISYKARGIDPRLSNGGAHIFRKYDPQVDQGKDKDDWVSHNFVVQYLFRPPEFEIYAEDMIKLVRYWGCSINAEDNVQALRQHFDNRGYGAFILYRRDFQDKAVMGNGDVDRPVRSNDEVINNYTKTLNTHFNRHCSRILFPEILQQALQFDPNNTQMFDCIVSAGYTLMAAEINNYTEDTSKDDVDVGGAFGYYDQSGARSVAI
jgi:hypothetical protein